MGYVDGYVLPVPKKTWTPTAAWRRRRGKSGVSMARWNIESVPAMISIPRWGFRSPKSAKAKSGETVVFAYIVFKSRAHRDRVNAKVMKDPRMTGHVRSEESMPFDCEAHGLWRIQGLRRRLASCSTHEHEFSGRG